MLTVANTAALPLEQIRLNDLIDGINADCTKVNYEGTCSCGPFDPLCAKVSYFAPTHLAAITKHPDHNLLAPDALLAMGGAAITDFLLGLGPNPLPIGGGAATLPVVSGDHHLHYFDVRIYSIPAWIAYLSGLPATARACFEGPSDPIGLLHYDSRIDPFWRFDVPSFYPPSYIRDLNPITRPFGIWGTLNPLSGHQRHGSAPTAAAVIATRGMHIAINPAHGRPIIAPAVGGSATCFQPAWPLKKPCLQVGVHPSRWEAQALTDEGTGAFLFWAKRTLCVPFPVFGCALPFSAGADDSQNLCR